MADAGAGLGWAGLGWGGGCLNNYHLHKDQNCQDHTHFGTLKQANWLVTVYIFWTKKTSLLTFKNDARMVAWSLLVKRSHLYFYVIFWTLRILLQYKYTLKNNTSLLVLMVKRSTFNIYGSFSFHKKVLYSRKRFLTFFYVLHTKKIVLLRTAHLKVL